MAENEPALTFGKVVKLILICISCVGKVGSVILIYILSTDKIVTTME